MKINNVIQIYRFINCKTGFQNQKNVYKNTHYIYKKLFSMGKKKSANVWAIRIKCVRKLVNEYVNYLPLIVHNTQCSPSNNYCKVIILKCNAKCI